MKVILTKDVPKLGHREDVVTVSDGYGRNYLIPQGLAVEATPENLNRIKQKEAAKQREREQELKKLQAKADKIDGYTLILTVNAGEEGRLFGSVTTQDIARGLKEMLGVDVDRKKIELDEPLKQLGTYDVDIKIHPDITATIKVDVLTDR